MGKEGDLWDDSALINAFDQAISTYKIMHGSKNKDNSTVTMQVTGGEIESNNDSENLETTRDDGEKKSSVPANVPDSGDTSDASYLEENSHADSKAAQPCLDSSIGQNINYQADSQATQPCQGSSIGQNIKDLQNLHNSYSDTQGVGDYNQLVGQYYELEEKRQKVLEQLNQYGGWNYQYMASASNSGVPYLNSQDYSMPACQVSDSNVLCSCCPCCSQCLLPPCTSVAGCSLGETCVGKPCNGYSATKSLENSFPCEDDKILKTAMGVAGRAMSTIRTTISGNSDKKEEKERNYSEPDQHNGPEMDLTDVLNAWYSAGFYTGKFLTEQSIANRRRG